MTNPTHPTDTYAEELARWARALALGQDDAVRDVLAEGSLPWQVHLFVDGNFEKRCLLLEKQLEFVAPAFEDFADLLGEFVEQVPMAAYDTGAGEAERFLRWLESTALLSPEQQDYVACQRARHAVEAAARKNRAAHLRFQELWSVARPLAARLGRKRGPSIHLNPLRVWTRFVTPALLGGQAEPPAEVLFYPVREDITTSVLGEAGRLLVEELAEFTPCTLGEWAVRSALASREELAASCRDLAGVGLVAFS